MSTHRHSVIVLVMLTLSTCAALRAQTTPCESLLVPLKPPSMFSCPSATTVCVSNQGVPRGHWVWMCPAGATPGNASGLDPSVILRGTPPPPSTPLANPIDTVIEIERLRALRLQNQRIEQQGNEATQPTIQPPPVRAAPVSPPDLRDSNGNISGRFWRSIPDVNKSDKIVFLLAYSEGLKFGVALVDRIDESVGMARDPDHKRYRVAMLAGWPGNMIIEDLISSLDHFYETPENRPIPISGGLSILAMRAAGESESNIQKEIGRYRAMSH
jgi:hypothetical protein